MPWHVWYALGSLPIANSDGRCRSRSALSRLALIRADGSPFLLLLLLHQHILPSRSNKSDRFSARPFARPIPVQTMYKRAVGEMFRTCDQNNFSAEPTLQLHSTSTKINENTSQKQSARYSGRKPVVSPRTTRCKVMALITAAPKPEPSAARVMTIGSCFRFLGQSKISPIA
jgi:hypothetical protein